MPDKLLGNVASMAPPGGRGAPGGSEPPGGRTPPGGRLPKLSVGHQGRSGRFRSRGAGGGPALRPGTKVTTTTTKTESEEDKEERDLRRQLLRKEVEEYNKTRTDTKSNGQSDESRIPHTLRGMGLRRKSKAKKQPTYGEDFRAHQKGTLAETEADLPTASNQASGTLSPKQELTQHQQAKKKALGDPPRFGFVPDPGGPLDTTDKQEEYQKRYDAYVDDYAKREAASQDPDEPVYGVKPAREPNENTPDYEKRFGELAANYLKKLGSPGHQQSTQQATGGTPQP